jgi:hypothetical protein
VEIEGCFEATFSSYIRPLRGRFAVVGTASSASAVSIAALSNTLPATPIEASVW